MASEIATPELIADDTGKKEATTSNLETDLIPKFRSIVISTYGGSKYLRIDSAEEKKPDKNEVEVTTEACGVNFLDIMIRQGLIDQVVKPPFILGSECAGVITAIGEDVTGYKVGDRVVVLMENGAWSEKIVVPAQSITESEVPPANSTFAAHILPWPAGLSASQASVMAFAYMPAYLLVTRVAAIRSGDVVLVHSVGGGVGSAIGQLAKTIPNVTLIGTASKDKHEKLTGLYAKIFTPDQDCVSEIRKLHPEGVDVILDCLSGEEIGKSYGLLKPMGRYILYGMSNLVSGDRKNFFSLAKHWFHMDRISPLRLHEENHILGGFSLKSLLFPRPSSSNLSGASNAELVRHVWAELVKLVDAKTIDPWVDSEWSFDEVKEAMARLQERKNLGKVVLLPKAAPKQGRTSGDS